MAKAVELDTVQAQRNIRNLRDELRLLGKAAGRSGKEIQQLTKPMTQLAKDFGQQSKRINSLQKQVDKLTGQLKKLKAEKSAQAAVDRRLASGQRQQLASAQKLAKELQREANLRDQLADKVSRAINRNLKMSASLKSVGAHQAGIDKLHRAFDAYVTTLNTAGVTTSQVKAAQRAWNAELTQAQLLLKQTANNNRAAARSMREMEKAAIAAGHASAQTSIFLKNIGSAAVFAVGPLSGLGARLIAFEAIAVRVGVKLAAIAAVFAAFALAAGKIVVSGIKMEQTLLKMETALKAVRGSAAAAAIDLEFVRKTTFDLGIGFETGADQFTKLAAAASASGIPMRDVRILFEGMSATAATLGLTTEETGRAFKAFEQIISKGVVSSEEIKQQLGDVLPGALGISASAMNITTSELLKMLEAGELLSKEFIAKIGPELAGGPLAKEAPAAAERLAASWQRLVDVLTRSSADITETLGLMEGLATAANAAANALAFLRGETRFDTMEEEMAALNEEVNSFNLEMERLKFIADLNIFSRLLDPGLPEEFNEKLEETTLRLQALSRARAELEGRGAAPGASQRGSIERQERLQNLPIAELDKLSRKLESLDQQFVALNDTSKSFADRLEAADAIDRTTEATEDAIKIIKKLRGEELEALAIKFGVATNNVEGMRKGLADLIIEGELSAEKVGKLRDKTEEAAARAKMFKEQIAELGITLSQFLATGANVAVDSVDRLGGTIDDVRLAEVNGKMKISTDRALELAKQIDELGITLSEFAATGANVAADAVDRLSGSMDDARVKEFNKDLKESREKVEKIAESIQKAIDKQILINANLRKQIGAEDEVVEQLKIELKVRQQNAGAPEPLIDRLIDLLNVERGITDEIERQLRMREAQERFFQSAGKSGVAERVSKFETVGTIPIEPSGIIGGARADQRKALIDETKELVRQNAVVQQRIAGNDELADQMEARFEIMKKFPNLTTEELNNLQKLTEKNKELNALLKEQEELEKVRRELAEDFASVIGTAFEDAIINGEKLSDVMQALLDDINRIILRVTVTKPLENFLTGVLTGEDLTGSKAGPGGTPFFGGLLGGLFSSGGPKETAAGGRTGRAGGVGTPGVGGGFAAEELEKLSEAAGAATGETEGLTRKIIGLGAEKTVEKVTTTTLTGSLIEFQVAVRLATQALNAMATGIGAGAGSGAASGGIAGLSSILNFGGSFGGDAGMPFGGQPPPFVPGFGFVGARQHGGPTGPNSPVLVGEAGPEVFIPNRAGRIEPMPRGERPIVVNQTMNVKSEDAPGFRRSARSNLRLLGRSAKSSLRGV